MRKPWVPRTALVAAVALGWLCLSAVPARLAAQGSKNDSHVKVGVTADKPDADGKQAIAVTLELDPGWHVYANPTDHEFFEKEATKVKASVGGQAVTVKLDYPRGKLIEDADTGNFRVYERKVTIKGTVQRPKGDNRPVEVTVGFQPCDEKTKKCLSHFDVKQLIP